MLVTITYEKGITGSNMMVFRQSDMQCILNTLMGIDEPPDDNYEFDEMGISAASEVMNQMMGASSTALSEFLGRRIYISIPTAVLMDEENTVEKAINMESGKEVVVILFDLTITDVMESQFIYIMEIDLAKMLVSQFMNDDDDDDDDANTVGINGDADVYLRGEQSSRSSSHAGGIQDTQPPYQQTPTNPPTPPYGYDYPQHRQQIGGRCRHSRSAVHHMRLLRGINIHTGMYRLTCTLINSLVIRTDRGKTADGWICREFSAKE